MTPNDQMRKSEDKFCSFLITVCYAGDGYQRIPDVDKVCSPVNVYARAAHLMA